MSLKIIGQTDESQERVLEALKGYEAKHPRAKLEIKRQNSVSIRIMIVDSYFKSMSRADRHDYVLKYLEELPDEVFGDITMLLLLTPEETKKSLAFMEFVDPIPSRL